MSLFETIPHPDSVDKGTPFGPIVQLAYHAPTIDGLADEFAAELGAGPFFLLENIPLSSCRYRDQPTQFDHSSAYGQYRELMVELIHQHDDQPSAVRDMFKADEVGLHHAAVFVGTIETALKAAETLNMPCALDAKTEEGVRFVMVDAREEYGFFLEFYEPVSDLKRFYDYVKRKSQGWDRKKVLRRLG